MAAILHKFMSFIFLILLINIHVATGRSEIRTCPASCNATSAGPAVRFPFRLNFQPSRCGYPGFELSCSGNRTYITLPNSTEEFTVQDIDYISQTITINDPDSCLPRRYLEYSRLGKSPFDLFPSVYYTLFNCSSDVEEIPDVDEFSVIECMSGKDFTVIAVRGFSRLRYDPLRTTCSLISAVGIPLSSGRFSDIENGLTLQWSVPGCISCEERGEFCGFKNYGDAFSRDIGCSSSKSGFGGLSRSAKYGITIGVALPALLCLIGLISYLCGKVKFYYYQHHNATTLFSSTSTTPESAVVTTGLDGSTIESYPKTKLGESGRLPKPNHNTCPICLTEYQPKETLRTIPACNHYFHADCIDEWLRVNGTCPLCRNSPPASTPMTPSTAASSPLSSSSSS